MPQIYCNHWLTWESVKQLPFKHLIFLPCTLLSHMIYSSQRYIKVGRNKSYFIHYSLDGDNEYTTNDICKMIELLVDNIYFRFDGQLFPQMVGIPMGTNCALLLADLFLYSYENEFLDKLAIRFNLSYCYIDDLICSDNKRLKQFISDIYIKELTIFDTTEDLPQCLLISICFLPDMRTTT